MQKRPSLSFRPIIPLLLFFLIICVVYSPVLYFDYVFHDDTLFWIKLKEYGFKPYLYHLLIFECRFVYAWLLTLGQFFVHKVSDLRFLRFSAILISSCNAYLLLQQLRRLFFSELQAFLAISAIFFLPGFSNIFFSASYSYILALSIFMACWSFHKVETCQRMIIPIFSFLLALTIYPSTAMFYWVMIALNILFVRDRSSLLFRNHIFRSMAVGLIGLLIYTILILLMGYSLSHKITNYFYNPYTLTHDWFEKLQWFFQEPIKNALNLWDIFPKATTSIIVFGFIIFTALFVTTRKFINIEPQNIKGAALTCLWQLSLLIFIFFLTFLPNLAAQGNAAYYRCLIPLTSLIWFILVWAIFQWMEIIPKILTQWSMTALLSLIVVYAGIKTYNNVLYYRVLPSYVEWNAYKSMIEEIRFNKKVNAIHIVLPFHSPTERYDEFCVLSSHFTFDIYHLIYCAFAETDGLNQHSIPLVYISYPGNNVLLEVKEIYFEELPNGDGIYKDINRDKYFHKIEHPKISLDDHGLTTFLWPQKVFSKKLHWYILNLQDLFRP